MLLITGYCFIAAITAKIYGKLEKREDRIRYERSLKDKK